MAATTTHSTSSLAEKLAKDYSDFEFRAGEYFAWNPVESVVSYNPDGSPARLFHELGHALLGHQSYGRDVELLKMESDAWQQAEVVAPRYNLAMDSDDIESHLDSYRDWLHARSTCPNCDANGIQTNDDHYKCIECRATWRVNEARTCGLKRYTDSNKNTP